MENRTSDHATPQLGPRGGVSTVTLRQNATHSLVDVGSHGCQDISNGVRHLQCSTCADTFKLSGPL